jgi:hypothetical protein
MKLAVYEYGVLGTLVNSKTRPYTQPEDLHKKTEDTTYSSTPAATRFSSGIRGQ